ncbi:MAG: preprotein translocase subunit SecG [Lachnospiraceae bacterium]|nr:preprotein translocase subunit SecG [Lachnospiraceae bacterium]
MILKTALTVILIILALILIVVVMLQEGKSAGLSGSINGAADTYWGKNKGRSMEGKLEKATKIVAVLFILIAIALNLKWW